MPVSLIGPEIHEIWTNEKRKNHCWCLVIMSKGGFALSHAKVATIFLKWFFSFLAPFIFLLKFLATKLQNRTFFGFDAEIRFWSRFWAREELRWSESELRRAELRWEELTRAEKGWDELRRCEKRLEDVRRGEHTLVYSNTFTYKHNFYLGFRRQPASHLGLSCSGLGRLFLAYNCTACFGGGCCGSHASLDSLNQFFCF